MSDRFDLSTAPAADPSPAMTDGWRRAAASLRRAAAEIGALPHDLRAYHRDDVWQGAVATAFGDELEQFRSRLSNDGELALGTELRAVADRLDARAVAVELHSGHAVGDLWARTPTDAPP